MGIIVSKKNKTTVVFPDVCKVPAPPAPFAPSPYPNIQYQKNLKKAKKVDAQASRGNKKAIAMQKKVMDNLSKSMGNEAGTLRGVSSAFQAVQMGRTLHKGAVGRPFMGQTTSLQMGMVHHKPKVKVAGKKGR